MSIFDFPRVNFKGTIQLNPGTANNDDYAGSALLPDDWGPFAGETLALIDSKLVKARTYGMSDADFIAWAKKAQPFDTAGKPGDTQYIIPAEWNYYGAMDMKTVYGGKDNKTVNAKIIGVQTGPDEIYTAPEDGAPLTHIIGSDLSIYGHFTDVNSEGSPPATQFFIDSLELSKIPSLFKHASVSKSASQWLNFYRNVNLTADGGAGAYVYHIITWPPDTLINIPQFEDSNITGLILRYYLYRRYGGATSNTAIEDLYAKEKTNPTELEIAGTFAPLYADESIIAAPTGRLMVSNTTNIPTPPGSRNNAGGGPISLAPAVLQHLDNRISADFISTFPDFFRSADNNPKYDFGPVKLVITNGSQAAGIGMVDYADTEAGDEKGWVFDFDISDNETAQQLLQDPDATFKLVHPTIGDVLEETDYYFVSNQQAIYAEQFGSGFSFVNQGTTEPATVSVYHRGQELDADSCPSITLWIYRSIPLQAPGDAEVLSANFKPGQPIVVDTDQPGNFLFTFTINDAANPAPAGYPPKSYTTFMVPPYVTNAPQTSLRILPNEEDFSRYYVDPNAAGPVGNDLLTFEVVYDNVLRTYYLLYPAMNLVFPLNNERAVSQCAQSILDRTEQSIWMASGYMPRTRDLSESRRTLLRAWCRKVLAENPNLPPCGTSVS